MGLVFSLLDLTLSIFDLNHLWYLLFIILILYGVLIFFGLKERKEELGGYMKYGQALVAGLLMSVIAGVILAAYNYLHYGVLAPGDLQSFTERSIQQSKDMAISFGAPEEEVMNNPQFDRKQTAWGLALNSLIGTPFMGFLTTLVMGAFTKKVKTEEDRLQELLEKEQQQATEKE